MTEQEWHKLRRMFIVYENRVFIAKQGNPNGHHAWFDELIREGKIDNPPKQPFKNLVRGYYLSPNVVFYTGDFEHWGCYAAIPFVLPILAFSLALPDNTKVWLGAKRGEIGDVWEGHILAGTIEQLREEFSTIDGE